MKPNRYTGVSFNKQEQKWRATVRFEGKLKHIGSYPSEIEAHEARTEFLLANNIEPYRPGEKSKDPNYKKNWRLENKERVKQYNANYRSENKEICYEKEKIVRRKLKQEIIDAYGGSCAECGESTFELLTIDHIEGDGAEHRRQIGCGSINTYRWLKKNGFPREKFQLLCWNCNCSKFFYGKVAKSSRS